MPFSPWRPARLQVPTGAIPRMSPVRVAVVDVGANTLRLLVAANGRRGLEPLREDRHRLGLGEEIERTNGAIGAAKLEDTAAAARTQVRRARKLGCDRIEVFVTSPGRQASNGAELISTLRAATGVPVRVLDAEEEGTFAWHGAVRAAGKLPESVAVCDVGGGSAQLVVGTLSNGPAWAASANLGSLRLTQRALWHDPPTAGELATARGEAEQAFAGLIPPLPLAALATGGTARALRHVAGRELDANRLETALTALACRSSRQITRDFGVDRARARTLTAGTLLLAEAQRRLGVPLTVARGGLREGAALSLLEESAAATG